MEKIGISLFLLCFSLVSSASPPNCCKGENVVYTSHKCSDGTPNVLTCDERFYMTNNTEDNLLINDEQNLVINNDDYYPPSDYCHAKTKSNKDVYLVCVTPDLLDDNSNIRILILVFQLISVFSFLLTIIIYLATPEMIDLQGLCKVHSMFGMMIAYIVLIRVNLSTTRIEIIECHLVAYVMYLGFLYAFFWLNVLCFHLWKHVINPSGSASLKKLTIFYHLYGIGGPLICLIILMTIHHWNPEGLRSVHPGIAETRCWFKTMREAFIFFYTPITILLTMNVIFFISTAVMLWKQFQTSRQTKVLKYRWRLYVKLFFIMGISWIFEILSATMEQYKSLKYLWLITDIINSLQGLIIFLILVVFRKRVLRALANHKLLKNRLPVPATWKYLQDSECEVVETELGIPMEAENTKL